MNKQLRIFLTIAGVVIVVGVVAFFMMNDKEKTYTQSAAPRPIAGNPQAEILVEEFSDFQCPACQSAESASKQLLAQYGEQIKFQFRHFPLTRIHPLAYRAALAAECANDQGKFWEYKDVLFANQPQFAVSDLVRYAEELELEIDSFSACLDERARDEVVKEDIAEANARNINATPTFFINGQMVQNWTNLVAQVGALLPPTETSPTSTEAALDTE